MYLKIIGIIKMHVFNNSYSEFHNSRGIWYIIYLSNNKHNCIFYIQVLLDIAYIGTMNNNAYY